jgi:mannitol/fructose-specific phosphotransferase system IIA component (Ntr-type)
VTISLSSLLRPETTLSRLGASGQRAAIHELVGLLIKVSPQLDPNELVLAIEQRERFYSTATTLGLAVL